MKSRHEKINMTNNYVAEERARYFFSIFVCLCRRLVIDVIPIIIISS
jgi:hypothetical protein